MQSAGGGARTHSTCITGQAQIVLLEMSILWTVARVAARTDEGALIERHFSNLMTGSSSLGPELLRGRGILDHVDRAAHAITVSVRSRLRRALYGKR